jgi:CheY-like chemotaxis protein
MAPDWTQSQFAYRIPIPSVYSPLQMKKPAKNQPKKTPKRPLIAKIPPSRARLLLVEDNDATRESVRKLLTARNFDVKAASSIAGAWALISETKFDVLISDIGLPDGDGYLLMRELKDRFGISGIALTGYDLEDDIKLSKEAGFSMHITKPVRAGLLDEALASLGI